MHRSAGLLGVDLTDDGAAEIASPVARHAADRQPAAAPGPRLRPGARRRRGHPRRRPARPSSSTRSTSSGSTGSTAPCSTSCAAASAAGRSASRRWRSPWARSGRRSRRWPSRSWSGSGFLARTPRGRVATAGRLGATSDSTPAGRRSTRRRRSSRTDRRLTGRPVRGTLQRRARRDRRPRPLARRGSLVQDLVSTCCRSSASRCCFWLLIIRPQAAAAAGTRATCSRTLDVGDEVILTSGVFGTVRGVDDDVAAGRDRRRRDHQGRPRRGRPAWSAAEEPPRRPTTDDRHRARLGGELRWHARPPGPGAPSSVFFLGLAIAFGLVALAGTWKPELGLDLQGGTSITPDRRRATPAPRALERGPQDHRPARQRLRRRRGRGHHAGQPVHRGRDPRRRAGATSSTRSSARPSCGSGWSPASTSTPAAAAPRHRRPGPDRARRARRRRHRSDASPATPAPVRGAPPTPRRRRATPSGSANRAPVDFADEHRQPDAPTEAPSDRPRPTPPTRRSRPSAMPTGEPHPAPEGGPTSTTR